MPESKIEKKRNWWTWAIAALVTIGLLTYLFTEGEKIKQMGDRPVIETEEVESIDEQEEFSESKYSKADLEVTEYNTFINDAVKLGADIKYTKDALVQLSNAVRQVATENGFKETAKLEKIKIEAARIQKSADSLELANNIKKVGADISRVIQELQEKEFPQLDGKFIEINKALAEIDPNSYIDEQREPIVRFFESCGDALKEMETKKSNMD